MKNIPNAYKVAFALSLPSGSQPQHPRSGTAIPSGGTNVQKVGQSLPQQMHPQFSHSIPVSSTSILPRMAPAARHSSGSVPGLPEPSNTSSSSGGQNHPNQQNRVDQQQRQPTNSAHLVKDASALLGNSSSSSDGSLLTMKLYLRSFESFKVLVEIPLLAMMIFQLYGKFVHPRNISLLVPHAMALLGLTPPPLASSIQPERQREFCAAQVTF